MFATKELQSFRQCYPVNHISLVLKTNNYKMYPQFNNSWGDRVNSQQVSFVIDYEKHDFKTIKM